MQKREFSGVNARFPAALSEYGILLYAKKENTMAASATAKAIAKKSEIVDRMGTLVDPGMMEVSPKLELLRESAALLNPMYQISCLLEEKG